MLPTDGNPNLYAWHRSLFFLWLLLMSYSRPGLSPQAPELQAPNHMQIPNGTKVSHLGANALAWPLLTGTPPFLSLPTHEGINTAQMFLHWKSSLPGDPTRIPQHLEQTSTATLHAATVYLPSSLSCLSKSFSRA